MMKHVRRASGPLAPLGLICEEEFAESKILQRTAKLINFAWLLADYHGLPLARVLIVRLARALEPLARDPLAQHSRQLPDGGVRRGRRPGEKSGRDIA